MPTNLDTFTDRREAIALFEYLRGRDPARPWPILPILTYIAPGGSGKSTLLNYLRGEKCGMGRSAAIPSAYLDFTLATTPKDLLEILSNIRDQLQTLSDRDGKHLTFPRFDLGSLAAQAAQTQTDISSLEPRAVRDRLAKGKDLIDSLNTLGSTLSYAVPYIPAILAGLKVAGQIKPLQNILRYLEDNTNWQWYRTHGTETGLAPTARVEDVLQRLYDLSIPGRPERENLLNSLLPQAFIDDLLDALVHTDPPRAWSKTANVVLFLDGFEDLQRASPTVATRLLQALTAEPYKRDTPGPVIVVIGTRDRFPDSPGEQEDTPFEQRTAETDQATIAAQARERHTKWRQDLISNRRFLRLVDLYLPYWISDFGKDDTHAYLSKVGQREQTPAFAAALVETIERVTGGHPLSLSLAAEAVLEAQARGRSLQPDDFLQAQVYRGEHEGERVRDYLLNLFLRQLPPEERKDLIFCAAPRFLDVRALRAALPSLANDVAARERWERYRRFTFTRLAGTGSLAFHPLVRGLLLQQLPPGDEPESDYVQTHQRLRTHFQQRAARAEDQASVEEAYHALALGDPAPAIQLGITAQRDRLTLWNPLLEAVAQAPARRIPPDAGSIAYNALLQADRHHLVEDAVTTIVLYTWLLTDSQENVEQTGRFQVCLGLAYGDLPGGDREENLKQAIICYEAALEVRTREVFPMDWAMTQNNLGEAHRNLPGGDREENLRQAIACYEAALEVYTRTAFPFEWATTQNNLGIAYSDLPGEDREENLKWAIACYEAALEVYTRTAFPFEWATTQNNLGIAYQSLPGEDREENLKWAIGCYEAALEVRTRAAFPMGWAGTQNNLGAAYRNLPGGDREANLKQAIACYEAALEVSTRAAFPMDWAMTQNNLGNVYGDLPGGDREANLKQAIACYEAALEVSTRAAFPMDWAMTQNNLGEAYRNLPGGDWEANLTQAIACYEAALLVYTQEAFPMEWATAQNNLGIAYQSLPGEDREENLRQAIACYEAALEVRTRGAFPMDWAGTQNNLGNAYYSLPGGDWEENLRQAIACYEAALEVFQLMHIDYYAQIVSENLAIVKEEL